MLGSSDLRQAEQRLQVASYFDNYPFDYYVVLQDVKLLPEMLADALRQWFEVLSQAR